jgi:hypothetical protein
MNSSQTSPLVAGLAFIGFIALAALVWKKVTVAPPFPESDPLWKRMALEAAKGAGAAVVTIVFTKGLSRPNDING